MSKEFKGTPGEWKQSHRQIPNDVDGMYSTQVYTEDGETIASLAWHAKPAVTENGIKKIGSYREANAKLISAAPELLKALVFLKQEYEQLVDCGDCGNWNPRQDNSIVLAEQAINKALN